MQYTEIFPSAQLKAFVKCYWQLEGNPPSYEIERVVPDGRMDMVFHYGDFFQRLEKTGTLRQSRSLVVGQFDKPIFLKPTGDIGIFGVRFRPPGFSAIFDSSAQDFGGQILPLKDFLSSLATQLEEKIALAMDSKERVKILESFLVERLQKSRVYDKIVRVLSQLLAENPQENLIAQFAKKEGLSLRQLERQFKRLVGLSPSRYTRIARFQKALRIKLVNPSLPLTTLAHECGYYDLSHLSREFKDISGLSPRDYFGVSHEMSDFFTLE